MSTEKFFIPKHLDESERLLVLSTDEAMVILVPLFVGYGTGHFLLSVLVAFYAFRFWKKIKGNEGIQYVKALIYWYYPKNILGLKYVPDSSVRHFIA